MIDYPDVLQLNESFPLGQIEPIVVALFDGYTLESSDVQRYRFRECETGILRWQYAGDIEDHKFWEFTVIWDNDSEQKPRRVSHQSIQVCGIQNEDARTYSKKPGEYGTSKRTLY